MSVFDDHIHSEIPKYEIIRAWYTQTVKEAFKTPVVKEAASHTYPYNQIYITNHLQKLWDQNHQYLLEIGVGVTHTFVYNLGGSKYEVDICYTPVDGEQNIILVLMEYL